MKRVLASMLAALLAAAPALVAAPALAADDGRPRIRMAILLDTSNSMDGLIDQARSQLWKIVNEFLYARKGERVPKLEVALYEYGNSRLPQPDGFLRAVTPFTDDLDLVSAELFALTTQGGKEYCGQAIDAAVRELEWGGAPDDLRVIFIAGNESFAQGPLPFRDACRAAIERGIVVNTIFCGPETTGINTHWKEGALLADGSFASIDGNARVAHVPAPQDAEITRLGTDLNDTYLPYGAEGRAQWVRQCEQDRNSAESGAPAAVQRMVCKSSANYVNHRWDLVDAVEQGHVDLAKIEADELPESMREMTAEQRASHVQSMAAERAGIRKRIQELAQARREFVEAEREKLADDATGTLDRAMSRCLREQARRCGIELSRRRPRRPGRPRKANRPRRPSR